MTQHEVVAGVQGPRRSDNKGEEIEESFRENDDGSMKFIKRIIALGEDEIVRRQR